MVIAPRPDAREIAATTPESRVQMLGRHGPFDYGVIDGVEYAIDRQPSSGLHAYAPTPGLRMVSKTETEMIGRDAFQHHRSYRALPVAAGTYARLVAEAEAKAAKAATARRPRPIDQLARLAPRSSDRVVPLGGAVQDTELIAAATLTKGAARSVLVPAQAAPRGPQAILDHLAAKGIELSLTPGGRLLVQAKGGRIAPDLLNLAQATERLLVGVITNSPCLCEMGHDGTPPEAVTLVALNVPSCAPCAAGEVAS